MNRNRIRGVTGSWVLITLSCYLLFVSARWFVGFFFLFVGFFHINIFIIHPKRAVGKKCKLGIFAPNFQMIQYTVMSLY